MQLLILTLIITIILSIFLLIYCTGNRKRVEPAQTTSEIPSSPNEDKPQVPQVFESPKPVRREKPKRGAPADLDESPKPVKPPKRRSMICKGASLLLVISVIFLAGLLFDMVRNDEATNYLIAIYEIEPEKTEDKGDMSEYHVIVKVYSSREDVSKKTEKVRFGAEYTVREGKPITPSTPILLRVNADSDRLWLQVIVKEREYNVDDIAGSIGDLAATWADDIPYIGSSVSGEIRGGITYAINSIISSEKPVGEEVFDVVFNDDTIRADLPCYDEGNTRVCYTLDAIRTTSP